LQPRHASFRPASPDITVSRMRSKGSSPPSWSVNIAQ
jgi:hypothetical protein